MFNSTNIAGASSTSASTYGSSYGGTATNHHIGPEQAGDLGLGLGRLARGGIDYLANWWQSYWNTPSQEQLSMDRQVKIFYFRIEECVSEFHSALNNLDKDPTNSKVHKEIESIASILEKVSPPNDSKDLQDFQNTKFDGLKKKISKMELPTEVVNKLKSTSPAWFQNMKSSEIDSKKGQKKKLENHRVKKHKRSGKQQAVPKQKSKAKGPFKPSFKATEEKIDGKGSLPPSRGAENKKCEIHSNYEREQVPTCPYVLSSKSFTLRAPISPSNTNGFIIAGIYDVNKDGTDDFAIADPGATPPDGPAGAGQVWIVYGGPNVSSVDLTNLSSSQGVVIYGVLKGGLGPPNGLGSAMVGLGDFNADGSNDVGLLVGAQQTVYVLFGPLLNTIDLTTCNGQKCFSVIGVSSDLGSCLAGGEKKDLNGDEIPDFLFGAPSTASGQFFGIFGGPGPWPAQFDVTQLTGRNGFAGGGTGAQFSQLGCPITMGNLQNNPIASFAVAAPGANNGAGIIYVFNGRNGTWPGILNFTLDGTTQGFTASGGVSGLAQALIIGGDFDKDGNTDIIATNTNNEFYDISQEPNPLNTPLNVGLLDGTNGGNVWQTSNTLGTSLAIIDINNDGNPDLATNFPSFNMQEPGGILLVLGQSSGLPPLFDLDTANSYYVDIVSLPFAGGNNNILGGGSLANLGNIIGNGSIILGVSALNAGNGVVYFLFPSTSTCPPPPTTTSTTGSTTDSATSPTSSTTTPSSPPSNNPGAIIGGVIGGIVLVAVGATFVFLKVMKKGPFAPKEEELPSRMQQNQFFGNL